MNSQGYYDSKSHTETVNARWCPALADIAEASLRNELTRQPDRDAISIVRRDPLSVGVSYHGQMIGILNQQGGVSATVAMAGGLKRAVADPAWPVFLMRHITESEWLQEAPR